MKEVFRSAFRQTDLIGLAGGNTVSVVAGTFVKIGEYKVQAGELVSYGFGPDAGMASAEGRLYALLKDTNATPVTLNGTLRISAYSPQDRPLEVIAEYRTETLSYGQNDRRQMTPAPEDDLWISEDKKLVVEFKSDTSATLSQANSVLLMDVTKGVV